MAEILRSKHFTLKIAKSHRDAGGNAEDEILLLILVLDKQVALVGGRGFAMQDVAETLVVEFRTDFSLVGKKVDRVDLGSVRGRKIGNGLDQNRRIARLNRSRQRAGIGKRWHAGWVDDRIDRQRRG